ncbi:MAG: hypothetical protein QOF78_2774 [Phycisphaerales bacterium]|jgi:hypothetical protein|nr:hypothetical protein [Phycisphaerales bacterium]
MATTSRTSTTHAPPPEVTRAGHVPRYERAAGELELEAEVLAGYLAEFENVDAIMTAAEKVRDAGYRRWDVHSPFPIHGMDDAMGIRPTILPWLVATGGVLGLLGGLALQIFANAIDYPLFISGKPLVSLPAFIPVIFECTIAGAAFTAVFGMLVLNKLPMLYNPLFKSERFRRVTSDRFFVVIDATDPNFDEKQTLQLLQSLNPIAIERFED